MAQGSDEYVDNGASDDEISRPVQSFHIEDADPDPMDSSNLVVLGEDVFKRDVKFVSSAPIKIK